jgi:hypothetical protein
MESSFIVIFTEKLENYWNKDEAIRSVFDIE